MAPPVNGFQYLHTGIPSCYNRPGAMMVAGLAVLDPQTGSWIEQDPVLGPYFVFNLTTNNWVASRQTPQMHYQESEGAGAAGANFEEFNPVLEEGVQFSVEMEQSLAKITALMKKNTQLETRFRANQETVEALPASLQARDKRLQALFQVSQDKALSRVDRQYLRRFQNLQKARSARSEEVDARMARLEEELTARVNTLGQKALSFKTTLEAQQRKLLALSKKVTQLQETIRELNAKNARKENAIIALQKQVKKLSPLKAKFEILKKIFSRMQDDITLNAGQIINIKNIHLESLQAIAQLGKKIDLLKSLVKNYRVQVPIDLTKKITRIAIMAVNEAFEHRIQITFNKAIEEPEADGAAIGEESE